MQRLFLILKDNFLIKIKLICLLGLLLLLTGCESDKSLFSLSSWGRSLATVLHNKPGLFLYGIGFLAGLATCLTPCVYPLIPITMALFGAREERISKIRSVSLALSYIAGIATMYTSLGIIYVLLAKTLNFGSFMQNKWVMIPVAVFFAMMGLSMLGLWTFALPASLQLSLNKVGGKGYVGAFAMGLVAGIIAAPCTAPALAEILHFIRDQKSFLVGGSVLFFYALGIGFPFLLIAAFALKLPKSGAWLLIMKYLWGIVLLVTSLIQLKEFFPVMAVYSGHSKIFLWVNLFITIIGAGLLWGNYYQGKLKSPVFYIFGIVFCVVGILGVLSYDGSQKNQRKSMHWLTSEQTALAKAISERKLLFIDFTADWCRPCEKYTKQIFVDPLIEERLSNYVLLKVNCTDSSNLESLRLQEKYQARTLPHILIISPQGKILLRIVELYDIPTLLKELVRLESQAK